MTTYPPHLWRTFLKARAAIELAQAAVEAHEVLTAEQVSALVWHRVDLPTAYVGLTENPKTGNYWIMACQHVPNQDKPWFYPLAVLFDRRGQWMQKDREAMLLLLKLLSGFDERIAREAAFQTDTIHDAPPVSAVEELRQERDRKEQALAARHALTQASSVLAAGKSMQTVGEVTALEFVQGLPETQRVPTAEQALAEMFK